jgi:SWI/SNF chromatin-remodeling complex subunit SWI1
VPLAREVDSAGGRDTQMLHQEMLRLSRGRPLRDVNEWGLVHVDALMMSLRSRLAIELSYALATVALLSTMRGGTPDSGFPIAQCTDLLDELLDLLEELAFSGAADNDILTDERPVVTNRELVSLAQSEGEISFAGLETRQGEHDPEAGPSQRPGDLIRILVNIIRNLSAITDNQPFMAQHPIIVDLLLRLTSVERTERGLQPISVALSISDLVVIRKDVLGALVNLSGLVPISENQKASTSNLRKARRIFELVSSYLSDPTDSVSPYTLISQAGIGASSRVPILVESALEVTTRFSQPDTNRRVLVSAVPQTWIWALFTALVHRLPVVDQDFQVIMREEAWLLYLERIVMALYSLGFQMPPTMKQRVKTDRSLGFTTLLMRLVKKFMTQAPAQDRQILVVCVRRAVETMKVIDDCNDSFDASQPNMPVLAFGMGYGEVGDDTVEKGTGALGGHREDLLWGVMLQREMDEVMFMELESLTRVECV